MKDKLLYYEQIVLIDERLDEFEHIILVLEPKQVHVYTVQFDEVYKVIVQELVMQKQLFFLKIHTELIQSKNLIELPDPVTAQAQISRPRSAIGTVAA